MGAVKQSTAVTIGFSAIVALSGFLLFALEPMVGKMVLPGAGGTPGAWNACLFFFQAAFLAGAIYARTVTRLRRGTIQAAVHTSLLLVALSLQPIAIDAASIAARGPEPALPLLATLVAHVAVPAVALCATTPLLLNWLARGGLGREDPYVLYVASNAGSLAGLLAYPLVIEPSVGVGAQSSAWSAGYAILAAMIAVAGLATFRAQSTPSAFSRRTEAAVPAAMERARWFVLAAVPSSLTLGVTAYLSADVAAGPLLWVIPLGLYLASWLPAFGGGGASSRWVTRGLMLFATPLLIAILTEASAPAALVIVLHLTVFFLAALTCHGRLAAERPAPSRASEFHLWIALGGAVGGLVNAVAAPVLFSDVSEYPLAIIAACALAGSSARGEARSDLLHAGGVAALTLLLALVARALDLPSGRERTLIVYLVPALLAYRAVARPRRLALALGAILVVASFLPGAHGEVVTRARSFFGVVRVTHSQEPPSHAMIHGRTLHGRQSLEPSRRARPLAYYDPDGPLGSIFAARDARPHGIRVAAIGLGTGAIASYARADEDWTFYEIDPVVVRFATDPTLFTFLRDSPARRAPRVVLGDGRLRIAEAPEGSFDLIVLDAFGSDAIPTHLLTREALALYREKLEPDGWLAVHLSNRLLDLEPLIASLAADAGVSARLADDPHPPADGREQSRWAVLARDEHALGPLAGNRAWRAPHAERSTRAWTDDWSSVWSLVRLTD